MAHNARKLPFHALALLYLPALCRFTASGNGLLSGHKGIFHPPAGSCNGDNLT
jgi:hypothetical protein